LSDLSPYCAFEREDALLRVLKRHHLLSLEHTIHNWTSGSVSFWKSFDDHVIWSSRKAHSSFFVDIILFHMNSVDDFYFIYVEGVFFYFIFCSYTWM
jgi:hypothetical protein